MEIASELNYTMYKIKVEFFANGRYWLDVL